MWVMIGVWIAIQVFSGVAGFAHGSARRSCVCRARRLRGGRPDDDVHAQAGATGSSRDGADGEAAAAGSADTVPGSGSAYSYVPGLRCGSKVRELGALFKTTMEYRTLWQDGLRLCASCSRSAPLATNMEPTIRATAFARCMRRSTQASYSFFDVAPYDGRTLGEKRLADALRLSSPGDLVTKRAIY